MAKIVKKSKKIRKGSPPRVGLGMDITRTIKVGQGFEKQSVHVNYSRDVKPDEKDTEAYDVIASRILNQFAKRWQQLTVIRHSVGRGDNKPQTVTKRPMRVSR